MASTERRESRDGVDRTRTAPASSLRIRLAEPHDADAIWRILESVIRAGETYALPRTMTRSDALAYWLGGAQGVYVAEDSSGVVGTYCLRVNRPGGGSHIANCGYMVAPWAGGRGVGRAMCTHSIATARENGFRAIQYNFVVATNGRAIRLYENLGFEIVGRVPGAFAHPTAGYVDAFVMFLAL
jgi:ribosomal protein S18 acetylase RimI-like enzyme